MGAPGTAADTTVGGGFWIAAGYLFALLGGLLGVGIGGMLWMSKVKDAGGQKTPKYNAGTRRHGLIILVLGSFMFAISTQMGDQLGSIFSGSSSPATEQAQPAEQPAEPPSDQPASTPAQSRPAPQQERSAPATQTYSLATPSNDYEGLVLDYLDATYEDQLQAEGVSPAFHSFVGELSAGGSERTPLILPTNEALVLFGVCDNECSDLDIVLRSSSGDVLDEDTQGDDIPLVVVDTNASPNEVSVEVRMITCTVEPCYYAVGVFRRN